MRRKYNDVSIRKSWMTMAMIIIMMMMEKPETLRPLSLPSGYCIGAAYECSLKLFRACAERSNTRWKTGEERKTPSKKNRRRETKKTGHPKGKADSKGAVVVALA
jgi:hypothetical protein